MTKQILFRGWWVLLMVLGLGTHTLRAQADSCGLRISLLTCSPGAELYSTFGHSALRVVDASTGTDIVYNYGVFDFYDPQFYTKFVRGKLRYYLDQEAYVDFLYAYQRENRAVREQVLSLSCAEKTAMQQFLFNNLRPENRTYAYDFLFDNCTTRLRDLILGKSGPSPFQTSDIQDGQPRTFRNHIHSYLNANRMPWAKLGIDILLGSRLDRKMTNAEAMFLPDYLEKALDSSRSPQGALVAQRHLLYNRKEIQEAGGLPFSPALLGWLLAALTLVATFTRGNAFRYLLAGLDAGIFFIAGCIGILLVFMWTGTDHQVCRDNLNLLWAIPLHAVAAFFVRSRRPSWKAYFHYTALLTILLLLSWAILPQALNPALIPFVCIIGLRAWDIAGRPKKLVWTNSSSSAPRP